MPRQIDSTAVAASTAGVVRPVFLVRLDYASGVVAVNSTPVNINYDGETYLGVGALGKIGVVQEAAELQRYGLSLEMSGIPVEYVSIAFGEYYQGRDAKIYLGFLDDGHRVTGEPVLLFRGRMDTQDIEVGETATITLSVQSRLSDWERARVRRYTDEDQQDEFPGDLGLQYVAQMTEKTIIWGRG